MTAAPRLSVGLPVYNGENYLAKALDALLSQTYTDFELIISDNASTDGTPEICRKYAAADSRIRYLRQEVNIGAGPNHNVVVQYARGEYFKWAAHDDLYGADLLRRCVEALDEMPDIVLAHAYMGTAGEHGEVIGTYDYTLATDSPYAPERFRSLLLTEGGDDFYGVIRTSELRRIAPHASYHNAGRKLVMELSLHGPFHQVPEVLYFRREHPGRIENSGSVPSVCAKLEPRRGTQSTARLYAEFLAGLVRAIYRAPLSVADRLTCYRHLTQWLACRAGVRRADVAGAPAVLQNQES